MTENKASQPAIRVVMMPRDANHQGNIFGGVILAYLDQAGFIEAKKQSYHTYVTVSVNNVQFLKPIFVGDIASFYTHIHKIGTTSLVVSVDVYVEAAQSHSDVLAATGTLTFVALDDRTRRPTPIFGPEEEKVEKTQDSS